MNLFQCNDNYKIILKDNYFILKQQKQQSMIQENAPPKKEDASVM